MDLKPEGLVESVESYEHLGEVAVCVMDLHARYDELMEKRRVVVAEEEAIIAFAEEINAPPPLVWSWLNDPVKRGLGSPDSTPRSFVPVLRPGGRTGAGATTHCVHGQNIAMRETVLDWKPFDYYTVEQDNGAMGITRITYKFEELQDARTRLSVILDGRIPRMPDFLSRPALRLIFTRMFSFQGFVQNIRRMVEEETARQGAQETPLPASAP
jgi:hypothetical protein